MSPVLALYRLTMKENLCFITHFVVSMWFGIISVIKKNSIYDTFLKCLKLKCWS